MKNQFLIILLFTISSFSQVVVKGTVYIESGTIEGAAVYLNNTMLGTTTNDRGEFSIPVKDGQYELIVSYLGYKKIIYPLNTSKYESPLIFALEEDESVLDEIIIKKTVYDDQWRYNLRTFKREFIGITELSKNCEILNPETLHFEYDTNENILSAFARKPLRIKHESLGYLITYELESFEINKNYLSYLGFSRYEELKGGKRKQKLWKKNRLKAYNGSPVHFYKSLLNDTFEEEGFVVNQFKRVSNKDRPSEEEIKKARKILRLNRNRFINFSEKENTPLTTLDSARVIIKKARLPKSRDYLYNSKLKKEEILILKNGIFYLSFDNNLSIVYTKEKEEIGFITRNLFSKKRKPLPQTSSLIPLKKDIILDKTGILKNPLDIYYEGYWSYEKFANTLPLDYVPEN